MENASTESIFRSHYRAHILHPNTSVFGFRQSHAYAATLLTASSMAKPIEDSYNLIPSLPTPDGITSADTIPDDVKIATAIFDVVTANVCISLGFLANTRTRIETFKRVLNKVIRHQTTLRTAIHVAIASIFALSALSWNILTGMPPTPANLSCAVLGPFLCSLVITNLVASTLRPTLRFSLYPISGAIHAEINPTSPYYSLLKKFKHDIDRPDDTPVLPPYLSKVANKVAKSLGASSPVSGFPDSATFISNSKERPDLTTTIENIEQILAIAEHPAKVPPPK